MVQQSRWQQRWWQVLGKQAQGPVQELQQRWVVVAPQLREAEEAAGRQPQVEAAGQQPQVEAAGRQQQVEAAGRQQQVEAAGRLLVGEVVEPT